MKPNGYLKFLKCPKPKVLCFQILRFDNFFDFENFQIPKINNFLILISCKYLKPMGITKIKYLPHIGAFPMVRDLFHTP